MERRSVISQYFKLLHANSDGMTLQELSDHRFELHKYRELSLQLLDELEARQKKPTKIN